MCYCNWWSSQSSFSSIALAKSCFLAIEPLSAVVGTSNSQQFIIIITIIILIMIIIINHHHHIHILLHHHHRHHNHHQKITFSGALISGDLPPGPTPLVTGAGQRVTITAFPHQVDFLLLLLLLFHLFRFYFLLLLLFHDNHDQTGDSKQPAGSLLHHRRWQRSSKWNCACRWCCFLNCCYQQYKVRVESLISSYASSSSLHPCESVTHNLIWPQQHILSKAID